MAPTDHLESGTEGGGYPADSRTNGGCSAGIVVDDAWRKEESLAHVKGLQDLSVNLYRHAAHDTAAVLAHVDGPLCSVGMFFATEAVNDKGLVHCLEHLCFMGSRNYPKGYLDLLATRCGCEGTNAYTDSDHTCFEFEVAGEAGLLAILPVFVDHVLCPLLTEDSFVTEIHHLNGKGERQGVVYSEMLGRISDEEDILDLEVRCATFGDKSPYSYEHGGMPDLILTLTRDEIAEYHQQVYTTDNLSIVVSGCFDEAKVLAALAKSLDAAVALGARRNCVTRPFASPLPALQADCPRRRFVTFPSDDISVGSVAYSRRLDGIGVYDTAELTAVEVLARFLTGLASSPLEQAFVQCDPPVANGVTCELNITAEPHITIELTGVPFCASSKERAAAKRLRGEKEVEDDEDCEDEEAGDEDGNEEAEDDGDADSAEETAWFEGDALLERLIGELRKVQVALLSDDEEGNVMLAKVRRAIKRESVSRRTNFEDAPTEYVQSSLIPFLIFWCYPSGDVVEGQPRKPVLRALSAPTEALEALPDKTGVWWAELLDKHLLRPLTSTLRGEPIGAAEIRSCPSAVQCLQNERREEQQAKKNRKHLGKGRLKQLQERVDAAEKANRVMLNEDHRAGFPSPTKPEGVPDLKWDMEVVPAPAPGGLEVLEVEVASNFVELHLNWLLDDAALPAGQAGAELRRYLSLFAALMCETDVGGENYRSVVARLDDELVSYSASVGSGSQILQSHVSNPCLVTLKLSAEPDRSAELVTWADRLAHECDFPQEKVLAMCRRIGTGLKENMRNSESVLTQTLTTLSHNALSPHVQLGSFSQRPFLERCCENINATCEELRRLRNVLGAVTTACTAVVSGATAECRSHIRSRLQEAWRSRRAAAWPSLLRATQWTAPTDATQRAPPMVPLSHVVVGCAGTDTANVHLRVALPFPPLALDAVKCGSLQLLCEALSMSDGPLSAAVRGKGLAYGASLNFLETENAVAIDLWECTNVRKCLQAAVDVVKSATGSEALNSFQLDNARGSLVFKLKSKRATPTSIVSVASAAAANRGWSASAAVSAWEKALGAVTDQDVLDVHRTCLLPQLRSASNVLACAVCDPSDCKQVAKGLAAALGLESSRVFVKTNIADCYGLVDGRIHDAVAALPSVA
eukprot:TRINITY_DN7502_c0_g1_i1.p1 TRINITY_DN7502_c0_g1~~TRINITY_DN7502_c0_g1_i1.p1  ORF type:complete len:1167 (+),score=217.17 TRINITY_DN7502_c0_g1_i1:59-3502(+)